MNKTEQFWDNRAHEYEKNEEKYRKMYGETITLTIPHLKLSDIVLDYGCGTGVITNEIATCVKQIHGIDISSKSIDVAVKKAAEINVKNVSYEYADIFDEGYGPESFDAILSFSVLHLIKKPDNILKRIHDMLVPEGLFISATPCLGEGKSIFSISLLLLSRIKLMPYIGRYKAGNLANLIADSGFQIVQKESIKSLITNGFIVARKI